MPIKQRPNTRQGTRRGRILHDIVDISIDTKVPIGDAIIEVPRDRKHLGCVDIRQRVRAELSCDPHHCPSGEMGEDPLYGAAEMRPVVTRPMAAFLKNFEGGSGRFDRSGSHIHAVA